MLDTKPLRVELLPDGPDDALNGGLFFLFISTFAFMWITFNWISFNGYPSWYLIWVTPRYLIWVTPPVLLLGHPLNWVNPIQTSYPLFWKRESVCV